MSQRVPAQSGHAWTGTPLNMQEDMPNIMSEDMPKDMSQILPERMSEDINNITDRMQIDMPL